MKNIFNDYLASLEELSFDRNDLKLYSAVSALKTTARIQRYYLNSDFKSRDEAISRLYSLLQGLFVSIDSLYILAYDYGNNKNYININSNKNLRKLRYIRNDVVGHPANRKASDDSNIYCILDDESVNDEVFCYHVYSKYNNYKETVSIYALLKSYYEEAIYFLREFKKIPAYNHNFNNKLNEIINKFLKKENYVNLIDELLLEKRYSYRDRIIWRLEIIKKLGDFDNNIIRYCNYLEFKKICSLVNFNIFFEIAIPIEIKELYYLFKNNKKAKALLSYLYDYENPIFKETILELKALLLNNKLTNAVRYIDFLITTINKNDDDITYALALPLKEYRKSVIN